MDRIEHLGHKIKLLDQLFKLRMNKNLEKFDITDAQMHVLFYISHHAGEKVTQKQLAEHLKVKHSTMAGILNRLKEKELIDIRPDEENKKYKNITLTPKACDIQESLSEYRNMTEEVLVEGFTKDEISNLHNYLNRVYDNLLNNSPISENDIECFRKNN